jgi:hypothetical protein
MVEGLLAWAALVCTIVTRDPMWAVASGVFAIAAQIHHVHEK